ncbi:hypothetical protein Pmani_020595 [Petrolisthes manimaculis]|uniref:Uncharacterized protein n=1 Tax=Petrolisthes manimaculis TaxID=1843537 RepID=A0AAE1U2E4_9EUCA|nr:hypothetical protein Pmani_020595 [Petrolisthes manimaculis]
MGPRKYEGGGVGKKVKGGMRMEAKRGWKKREEDGSKEGMEEKRRGWRHNGGGKGGKKGLEEGVDGDKCPGRRTPVPPLTDLHNSDTPSLFAPVPVPSFCLAPLPQVSPTVLPVSTFSPLFPTRPILYPKFLRLRLPRLISLAPYFLAHSLISLVSFLSLFYTSTTPSSVLLPTPFL